MDHDTFFFPYILGMQVLLLVRITNPWVSSMRWHRTLKEWIASAWAALLISRRKANRDRLRRYWEVDVSKFR